LKLKIFRPSQIGMAKQTTIRFIHATIPPWMVVVRPVLCLLYNSGISVLVCGRGNGRATDPPANPLPMRTDTLIARPKPDRPSWIAAKLRERPAGRRALLICKAFWQNLNSACF
jgi:hypothetical protein